MKRHRGRYRILDELGSGGMGAVYRAEDRATKRVVAFKELRSRKEGDKRAKIEALFEREYHTLVRLKHPRIIEVYDYGLTENGPYYTMELLDGKDLQELAPMPYRDACRHLREVASSLALLHAHRLVHRDVSPRNVRLTSDGRAKLIDFGALCAFGIAGEVAGTPASMAPEVLRRLQLDQRTDLFALGAVAYWALTGRHAFAARQVSELPARWQQPLVPPSAHAPDVPSALDALVLSLLSLDPLGRPASAAAVIDQLTAIAELEPEAHEQAAESYLSSSKLVGRGEELAWFQHRIARALSGKGTEVMLEGPSGIGKTRLLHEICLDAQLKGLSVLRADAQASTRSFGTAVALAEQLLASLPEAAPAALGPGDAQLLAHLSPELARALQAEPTGRLSDDPAEQRARFQTALHAWFTALCAERAIVVAVDNIQAADDNSAAFLAALGYEARARRLILLAAQTSGEAVAAEIPLRALRKRAARIKLAALSSDACEELVCSLFGSVPNTGRLAKVLYDKSAGNPQLCTELAQLLVKRKIAKYVEGSWVLPLELADDELPSRAEELVRAKLAELSPEALRLCEALSIHEKRVPIERCLSLAVSLDERALYLALDELVAEHVLVLEDGSYGFRQQALRECVLERIDAARRRNLHLQAAQAALAQPEPGVSLRVDAAWHLLAAGEELRGADLIAGATREFLRHQGVENVEQIVKAVEIAIELYEKHGRSKYEVAGILFPLMSLAFFVDWRVPLKHGERALRLGLDITGLGLAHRLSRFLPDKLALGLGLGVAALRFAVQRMRGLKLKFIEAVEQFCALVPAAIGTQNIVFDLPALQRFVRLLEPLKLFGKKHIASLMYDFANTQYLMGFGREREANELLEELRRVFPDPAYELKQVLGEGHWKAMYGGILFSLGIGYSYDFGGRALAMAGEMEELGVRVWAMAAEEIRMMHHAARGESEAVQRCRERVELFAVQGSTTWQADIFWPILLLDTEIRAGDTIAVRTIREQLTRRAKDHPSLQAFAEVAHCAYLTMRGEHRAAIAAFDRMHARLRTLDPGLAWPALRASFALSAALNAVGEHERAKRFALENLARAGEDVATAVLHYLEPQRQLALAEAGLGNHEQASAILDSLLERHGGEDQPLLIGLLHKARAEVALYADDTSAFDRHYAAMVEHFSAARNPTLIAQCSQLAKRARREPLAVSLQFPSRRPATASGDSVSVATQRALSNVSGVQERADLALQLVLKGSGARAGYLYLIHDERVELVAQRAAKEPAPAREAALLHEIERAHVRARHAESPTALEDVNPGERSVFIESVTELASERPPPPTGIEDLYRAIVLSARRANELIVVGGMIVEFDPQCSFTVDSEMLEPIACALLDSVATGTGITSRMLGSEHAETTH